MNITLTVNSFNYKNIISVTNVIIQSIISRIYKVYSFKCNNTFIISLIKMNLVIFYLYMKLFEKKLLIYFLININVLLCV